MKNTILALMMGIIGGYLYYKYPFVGIGYIVYIICLCHSAIIKEIKKIK